MKGAAFLAVVAVSACVLAACAPAIDTAQASWVLTLETPEPTASDAGGLPTMDWCPQILIGQLDPLTGLPAYSTATPAPTNVVSSLSAENDDVYTLFAQFNPALFGPEIVFDVGPFGTFYAEDDVVFAVAGDSITLTQDPRTVTVTRRVVGGRVSSSDDFGVTLDYAFDCDEITVGDDSCSCDTQRLTWSASPGGQVF